MEEIINETAIIIDDDKEIIDILKSIVAPYFKQIYTADNGNSALEIIEKNNIDFVLLDIHMPGVNGFDVLKRINELPKNIITILVSGKINKEYVLKAIGFRAFDYILKPFNKEKIEKIIKLAISCKKKNDIIIQNKKKNIEINALIYSDNDEETNLIKNLILSFDYGIEFTDSINNVQERILKKNYDLILLNKKRHEDNILLLKKIKTMPLLNKPWIFFVSEMNEINIDEAYMLGADECITKPIKPVRLKIKVKNRLLKIAEYKTKFISIPRNSNKDHEQEDNKTNYKEKVLSVSMNLVDMLKISPNDDFIISKKESGVFVNDMTGLVENLKKENTTLIKQKLDLEKELEYFNKLDSDNNNIISNPEYKKIIEEQKEKIFKLSQMLVERSKNTRSETKELLTNEKKDIEKASDIKKIRVDDKKEIVGKKKNEIEEKFKQAEGETSKVLEQIKDSVNEISISLSNKDNQADNMLRKVFNLYEALIEDFIKAKELHYMKEKDESGLEALKFFREDLVGKAQMLKLEFKKEFNESRCAINEIKENVESKIEKSLNLVKKLLNELNLLEKEYKKIENEWFVMSEEYSKEKYTKLMDQIDLIKVELEEKEVIISCIDKEKKVLENKLIYYQAAQK